MCGVGVGIGVGVVVGWRVAPSPLGIQATMDLVRNRCVFKSPESVLLCLLNNFKKNSKIIKKNLFSSCRPTWIWLEIVLLFKSPDLACYRY